MCLYYTTRCVMNNLRTGNWVVHSLYEMTEIDGIEYIVPDIDSHANVYDLDVSDTSLLCKALKLGKAITDKVPNYDYNIFEFVHDNGLLGIMPDMLYTDMNGDTNLFVRENIFTEQGIANTKLFSEIFFPYEDTDILSMPQFNVGTSYRSKLYTNMFLKNHFYAEPLEWFEKYFKYLYALFIGEKENLSLLNSPNISYRINESGKPICEYASLKSMIDFEFMKAVTDKRKPLRFCKHCGEIFYAADSRSEFCSPSCRNRFNVYKSRAKH